MMLIPAEGSPLGTVGGGGLEAQVIKRAQECLQDRTSKTFTMELSEVPMTCGGRIEVFIRVFNTSTKLLIVGDGHIAQELYKIGYQLGYQIVIFGDRADYTNRERFPWADELRLGNFEQELHNYQIDQDCYVVIATRGHQYDELALKAVINTDAAYIGMIGSQNKAHQALANLSQIGISEQKLNQVYTPVGLALGGRTPAEIALSIMAEVVLIKNRGSSSHLKDLLNHHSL